MKILVFEDDEKFQAALLRSIAGEGKNSVEVVPFFGSGDAKQPANAKGTYEEQLVAIFSRPQFADATMILADRDLSRSPNADFIGLSSITVQAAAQRHDIPFCSYSRVAASREIDWRIRWEESQITLQYENPKELARQALIVARGFKSIAAALPRLLGKRQQIESPAKLLADLLGKPEYASKIGLYSVGDRARLAEIPPSKDGPAIGRRRPHRSSQAETKKWTCLLGYWLWDSILRYPGILVNEVAAASHLNIATSSFKKSQVTELFKKALYQGPFADHAAPQWWRGDLDDLVSGGGCIDGLEYAKKKTNGRIARSQCSVDPKLPAGYYCILSRSPVSIENSKGGLSWFPRGADLTRVSINMYQELAPWIGD